MLVHHDCIVTKLVTLSLIVGFAFMSDAALDIDPFGGSATPSDGFLADDSEASPIVRKGAKVSKKTSKKKSSKSKKEAAAPGSDAPAAAVVAEAPVSSPARKSTARKSKTRKSRVAGSSSDEVSEGVSSSDSGSDVASGATSAAALAQRLALLSPA